MSIKILGSSPRTGGSALANRRTTITQKFLAKDARFFGELGVPNDQPGWVDAASAPATITVESREVFGLTRDVVKHFDDGGGITNTTFALTAQDWVNINTFGAAYGGTAQLDSIDGANGFFTGLQANATENPIDATNKRYQINFNSSAGFLQVAPLEGGSAVMDGTLGNPKILFDEDFQWECVVPPGLGAAKLFVNGIETTVTPTFATNAGGLGTHVLVGSGSSGGTNRVVYHSDFGVTIYQESATKTFSVAAMQSDTAQMIIPPGRRDYIITVPDGNPRGIGARILLTKRNVGGNLTLKAQNTAIPQALFVGLNEITRRTINAQEVTLINSIEDGNVYDFGEPPAQPDRFITAFVSTADVTVANTVAETTLLGLGKGTLTVPADSTKIGDRFSFSIQGIISSTGNPTLRLQLKSGAVILADTGAKNIGNLTNGHWLISGEVVTRLLGVAGTATISGSFVTSAGDHFEFVNVVPVTVDTTINRDVDVTAIWGTAAAANTITAQIASLTKILTP